MISSAPPTEDNIGIRTSTDDEDSGEMSHYSTSNPMSKIHLDPDEETLLMVLYLRVRDAASPSPILGDVYAGQIINKVDCDFTRSLFTLDKTYIKYIAGRSKQMDVWCQDFLDQHQYEDVLVLHLACGLDSRNMRVQRGANVKWIDVDRPQVTSVRQRLVPQPPGDYQLITASVADDDDSWLQLIPSDRPVLIIMEGLTMYITPEDGTRLLQRLLKHFPHGHLVFDTIGSITVMFTKILEAFKSSGARIKWGIDNASDLERLDIRLVLREKIFLYNYTETGWFSKGYPPLFSG